MFLGTNVGTLTEPLSGRRWERETMLRQVHQRAASYHRAGMGADDRVFLHSDNSLEFFADLLAVWSLDGCVIPIDPRLTSFEVHTLAETIRPRFALWHDHDYEHDDAPVISHLSGVDVIVLETSEAAQTNAGIHDSSIPLSPLTLDHAALILLTSGTTGQAKGVVHTHRSLRARWMALRSCLGLEPYRRTLCILPTHFGHGLICNCLFPWLAGQDLFLVPPFQPQLVLQLGQLIDEYKITFLSSVPALWRLALRLAKPPHTQTLERVFCGSAPLSASLWQSIQTWTGTSEVWNVYGITETGSWVAGTSVPHFIPADGLIGEPWGTEVKILHEAILDTPKDELHACAPGEEGYVWLKTPGLMQGYFEREDLTRHVVQQGWFLTGDIGLLDDQGRLYLRGRKREEINKGGMKVYPGDIDAVIEQCEGIVDVCSFGYTDETLYGQNIGVAVVMQNATDDTLLQLSAWTRHHLAVYQIPARWYVMEQLPRTSRGKVNRAEVAAACARLVPVKMPKRGIAADSQSSGKKRTSSHE